MGLSRHPCPEGCGVVTAGFPLGKGGSQGTERLSEAQGLTAGKEGPALPTAWPGAALSWLGNRGGSWLSAGPRASWGRLL